MTAKGTTRGLIAVYALYFMAVGITLPFLPGYFATLSLSGSQVGVLLGVGPTLAMVMPPLWGHLADRTGRGGRNLVALGLGSAAGYALLAQAKGFAEVLGALLLVQAFLTPITSQADAIALSHCHSTGRTYASLRRWGSVGFVLATLAFGLSIDRIDRRTVLAPLWLMVAMAATAAVTLARQPLRHHEGPPVEPREALRLLGRKDVSLFLAATALHWIASAPYHGLLTLHIGAMGWPPAVVSLGAAVAVSSEVVVMSTWSRWAAGRSAAVLLQWSFAASAGRWLLLAVTDSPVVVVLSSVLHGMTFGAFYLAAVASMSERIPPRLRATGQSLFSAATFGLGGLLGFTGAGWLFDAIGGHWLFALAAAAEALPALALAAAQRHPVARAAG